MAARSLGTLTLDIVAKIGGLQSGMTQAERIVADKTKKMETAGYKFGAALGTAIKVGIGAAATFAVAELTMAINAMDDLSKTAQKIGVGTEELSKFAYAAELADVPLETLQTGLSKLIKYQSAAAQGNKEATEAFSAFGIAVRDSSGHLRATEDVLGDFAEVFKNLPDGPEKTALALRVFGKSGAELIPFLNEGKQGLKDLGDEASRFGQVVSTEAGKNAEEFNDNLSRLKLQVEGLAIQVASDLLPDLIDLVDQFQDLISEGGDVTETAHTIAEAFRAVADVVAIVVNLCQAQSKALAGVGLAAKSVLDFATNGSAAASKTLSDSAAAFADAKNDMDQAFARLQGTDGSPGGKTQIGKDFKNVSGTAESAAETAKRLKDQAAAQRLLATQEAAAAKGGRSSGSSGKSDAEREAERLQESYDRIIEQQKEQAFLLQDTGKAAQERYDTEFGALSKLDPLKKQEIVDGALLNEQLKAEKDLLDDKNKAALDQANNLSQLLDDLQFENDLIGKTNAERGAEIELRRLGIDLTTKQGQATRDNIQAMIEEGEARQKQIEGMDEFRGDVKDLFVDLTDGAGSAKDAFDDFIDNFRKKMLALLAQKLVEKLLGSFGSAGGGLLGAFGQLAGSALQARAGGGPVSGGTPYLVGERGPEVIVPKTAGMVVPNSAIGKNTQVNQTFVIDTKGQPITKETQQQIAQSAGRAAAEAMARNR